MAFPFIQVAELLLRATSKNRDRPPSPEHRSNVEAVAHLAQEHDAQQDARILALERRLLTLEKSLELMLRARSLNVTR